MMKLNVKLLFIYLTLLLVNGCSTPSTLNYDNSNLNLQVADKRLQVETTHIKTKRENFSILFLEQRLLRLNDGSLVMYEEAQTDIQYMFEPTTTRTISVVFDAINVRKVYEQDFIFAYQLVLKDQRILNIIVSQGYDQELQMLYGMSSKQFLSILNRLDANINVLPYKNVLELKNEPNPLLSNWTTWKINFYPLVIPLRHLGRF